MPCPFEHYKLITHENATIHPHRKPSNQTCPSRFAEAMANALANARFIEQVEE
jgi:hypothetical protein